MKPTLLLVVPLPPPWAGVEQVSSLLVNGGLEKEFQVRVLKSNIRSENRGKGAWDFSGVIRVAKIALQLTGTLIFSRPDLVYMTLSQNGSGLARDCLFILICRIFRSRTICHLHGSKLHEFIGSQISFTRKVILNIINSSDRILVYAESIKKDLSSYVPLSKMTIISNGWPQSSLNSALEKGGKENGSFHVSFMGHLSAAKGFYDLIEAAKIILAKTKVLKFVFAGERVDMERNLSGGQFGQKTNWENFESLKGAFPDNISLVGVVTGQEKKEFFSTSDVFVLPSYAEAFPMVVLEAMNAGLPLVVTRVGALPEILIEDENCLFVPTGDPSALAASLMKLLDDEGLRMKMRRANLDKAGYYSIDKMISNFADIFHSVLDSSRA